MFEIINVGEGKITGFCSGVTGWGPIVFLVCPPIMLEILLGANIYQASWVAVEPWLCNHIDEVTKDTLRETDRRRQDQMVETLRVIRDMRREMSDMQAELLALREQQRRARQPGPEARIPDHQEASGDADSHI
ncbi:hypothetical protein Tco_1212523 [Tanacetum coccineum]